MSARPLSGVEIRTLRCIRDGEVNTTQSYNMIGCRADTYGRLEERGLVEVDWDSPIGLRQRSPAYHTRYPVRLTQAGIDALAEIWKEHQS